jgi:two-component system response regulator HydG
VTAPTSLIGRRILVVDDDRAVRAALNVNLSKSGADVVLVNNAEEALAALRSGPFDAVISDVKMPGATGIELLGHIRASWPDIPVVVMTGYGSVTDAVAAMKAGAGDYIIKPIAKDELIVILERAIERRAMQAELQQLRHEVADRYGFENLVGSTAVMRRLYDDIAAVADTSATVLLQGPTGTGKELLAHAIHYRSRRAQGPFIRVNCAAIPETLLESELFGHEKGAFSGAIRQHHGKFEQADGGSILLDEIGEIDMFMQVKLLRVLENGEFQRVGGTQNLKVDVRVIAATNKNLRQEVEAGRFRQDLFYRLNVVTLRIPSLHERADDIPLLVEHFVQKYAEKNHRAIPRVAPAAIQRLMAWSWPGNVRQLEHTVERAVILGKEGDLLDIALPDDALDVPIKKIDDDEESAADVLPPQGTTLQEALEQYERKVLVAALQESEGVQAAAARRLGISRSNLNYRINRLGIKLRGIAFE